MIQTQYKVSPMVANASFRPKLAQSVALGNFEHNATSGAPDVQFGGLSSIITKPFRWMYGKWNGFWNRRLEKDAINQLQIEREKLVDAQKKFDEQKVTTEAQARMSESQLAAAKLELEKVKAEAVKAYNAAQVPGQADNVKAELMKRANQRAEQVKLKMADVASLEKTAAVRRTAANTAVEQCGKVAVKLKEADGLMAKAQQQVREAERNEEAAAVMESVKQFNTDDVLATSDAARLMQAVNQRVTESQVRLEQATGVLSGENSDVSREADKALAQQSINDNAGFLAELAAEANTQKSKLEISQGQGGASTSGGGTSTDANQLDPILADLQRQSEKK